MKRRIVALLIAIAAAGALWFGVAMIFPRNPAAPLELTICTGSPTHSALIYLAEEQGLFRKHGLTVHLKTQPTGKAAVTELLAGRADAALAAEFVLASQAVKNPGLLALASIARIQIIQLAALAERGLAGPQSLGGLRIGLPRGTQAEFFLGLTLLLEGVAVDQVSIVDLTPGELGEALASGRVDAVMVWEPFVNRMRTAFGKRLLTWPAQGDRDYYWTLITTQPILDRGDEAFKRLFLALVEAEVIAVRKPHELVAVIERVSGESTVFAKEILPKLRFRVAAEQGLITALEDEWRWLARTGAVSDLASPDFLSRIRVEPLQAVAPEKISLHGAGKTP